MIMVTTQGVENLLANLNFNKAEGPDGISPCVLREFAKEVASILTAIYWSSLKAANHYIFVIVYCAWDEITTLPHPKTFFIYFQSHACMWASDEPATGSTCAFFVFVVLVVSQPFSVHLLSQLTSHCVWFSSYSYASLPGKTTSIFSHFELLCWSKKLKASSWVVNIIFKNNPKFPGTMYRKVSMHCLLLGTFLSPMAECMASNNASAQSITSTKEKW